MSYKNIVAISLLLLPQWIFGQANQAGSEQPAIDAQKLIALQALHFKMLDSIEYRLTSDVTYGVAKLKSRVDIHWSEKANCFHYTWVQSQGGTSMRTEVAFDGQTFQIFPPDSGNILVIKKGLQTQDIKVLKDELITSPFSFMRGKNKLPFTYVKDLKTPKEVTIANDAQPLSAVPEVVERDGDRFLCLSFNAGVHEFSKKPLTRKVYFDERNGYFPMISELLHEPGVVIGRYRVTELGAINDHNGALVFRFPKTAEALYYGTPPDHLTTEPSASFLYRITDVKINNVPDDRFSLDPSSADKILDADNKVYINIPK